MSAERVDLLDKIRRDAARQPLRIAFPESADERTLKSIPIMVSAGSTVPVLVGEPRKIVGIASGLGVSLDAIEIFDPAGGRFLDDATRLYLERMASRGVTEQEARETVSRPLYAACMLVKMGKVAGVVSGATHTTSESVRAYLRSFGPAPGIRTVSSFFLMATRNREFGEEGVMAYSDCAVVPDPDSAQLAEIAICAARSFESIVGKVPRVAFLSFSTKGSAADRSSEKVARAVEIFKARSTGIEADGELQFDAAVVPKIAARKAPGSTVAGRANVFVFPNLDAGNIAYKITERVSGAAAIGPILQGLGAAANDLSRGCSPQDIADVAAITVLQAGADSPAR